MYDLLVERPGLEEAAEEVDSADLLEAASRCMSHPRPGRDPVEIRSRPGRDQVEIALVEAYGRATIPQPTQYPNPYSGGRCAPTHAEQS